MVPKLVVIALLAVATIKVDSAAIIEAPRDANLDWWKNAVIYKIYTRTFKDGDGNGIGDFKGINKKLGYLQESGVTAIWLPPIQQSVEVPTVDHDYEITDYTTLNSVFGSKRSFNMLIKNAHKVGIKIILEIVPNHSSKQHKWFVESAKAEKNDYSDYYVWAKTPNNWISHFNKPAWTLDPVRGEYYLHQFGEDQPDLNHYHGAVRTEMEKVLTHWLDLGVDGFVIADAPFLIEDQYLTNEDPSGVGEEGEYVSLIHENTSNLKATYHLIAEWRALIDEYSSKNPSEDPRILITKAHTDLENAMWYYGKGDTKGAHFTYNFLLEEKLKTDLKAQTLYNVIEEWSSKMPDGSIANWVLGNHDLYRIATRFGPDVLDSMNILLSFLPGIMITYNGEEIGQENGEVKFAECKDPLACQEEASYASLTRDFERTPFHWDDSVNAGFTTSEKPWLPASEKNIKNNLKLQSRKDYPSHYHTYQDLTKMRQEYGFGTACVDYQVKSDNVLELVRKNVNGTAYVALINTSDEKETIDLSESPNIEKYVQVVAASSASKKHNRVLDATKSIVLDPYESIVVKTIPTPEEGSTDWWKHAVVYQIYPLSFKDSNNDGYGDLNGIISKLEYLKETGIDVAWLSPIYKSPLVDAGYDISDYRAIDKRFGTDRDFEKLVTKAHEIGMKIVMDFVPNHSSDQHEWFIKSAAGDEEYKDFYIWREGRNGGEDPPNNWLSLFKGPAWTKHPTSGLWYLHQFAPEQPDLNYRNPRVVAEMKDVMKFWMDKGVDGFRIGAVPYLIEDEKFLDEPPSGKPGEGEEHGSLIHRYTSDQEGTFEMIYQWREFVDDYTILNGGDTRILMTEAYSNIINTMKYYGNETRDGGHFTFNFLIITDLRRELNAPWIVKVINEWLYYMPEGRTANWVLGNHDHPRVATRFHSLNVDGLNMLTAMLPGVMVTYNGEEIGQKNGDVTYEQGKDPSACKVPQEFYDITRDFQRTPFHWDNTENAGFNDGNVTWLPVSSKYVQNNLAAQNVPDIQSHYNVYKKLLELRQLPVTINGKLEVKALTDNIISVVRKYDDGGDALILFFNVRNVVDSIDVKEIFNFVTPYLEIKAMSRTSNHLLGELISNGKLLLDAHEAVIVATTTSTPTTTTTTTTTTTSTTTTTTPNPGRAAEITISIVSLLIALICSILIR